MTPSFATCDLCDAHKNDSPDVFRVLPPAFKDFGARRVFCGPVDTVKCFEDNSLVKAAVDAIGYVETPEGRIGKVLVVDGAGSLRRALLGGNLGAAAAKNGWAGVVIDGCVRDVTELAPLEVGIRALASISSLKQEQRWPAPGYIPQSSARCSHVGSWWKLNGFTAPSQAFIPRERGAACVVVRTKG